MDVHILVPNEVLLQTPSNEDGVSATTERRLRIYGVELIQRAANMLRLPQIASASAAAIFQRFYFRRSFAEFDVRAVAPTALFLACKLEEHHRRLKDVILVFHRLDMRSVLRGDVPLYRGGPTPALDSSSREAMKQEIIKLERLILRELGYVVALLLEHPHKYVIQFVKSMVRSPQRRVAELAQRAWNYLNDSTRTVLCCMYAPHQITTASIFLAARDMRVKLPTDPPWWLLFDTQLEDLQNIARKILALYTQPPARFIGVPTKLDPFLAGLATPGLETPGPMKSPISDEDGGKSAQGSPPDQQDLVVESDRISEMLHENESAVPQTTMSVTRNLPGSISRVETARPRSRSPKRKVVQLKLSIRPGMSKSKSF
jgi:transcription initiation factor TFIIIB Brf1 subunit/transcription initiation factor TFIIB